MKKLSYYHLIRADVTSPMHSLIYKDTETLVFTKAYFRIQDNGGPIRMIQTHVTTNLWMDSFK